MGVAVIPISAGPRGTFGARARGGGGRAPRYATLLENMPEVRVGCLHLPISATPNGASATQPHKAAPAFGTLLVLAKAMSTGADAVSNVVLLRAWSMMLAIQSH